jgi:hypothetical protein
MTKRRLVFAAAVVLIAAAGATTAWARRVPQRPGYSGPQSYSRNVRYDGRFVFIRMSYAYSGRSIAPWSHDYNAGEFHFLKIMQAVTNIDPHIDESSIMSFSDPELFKFPVAYLVEPGYWTMSDTDVTTLRAYLQKGGFLIVDDFPLSSRGVDTWGNFDSQISRVFPEGKWMRLDAKNPLFHSFFEIDDISNIPTAYNLGSGPQFWALYEDNDPTKRIMVIANYMNDISEFWEWSDKGQYLMSDTNEAYKFGVNEFLYGITH